MQCPKCKKSDKIFVNAAIYTAVMVNAAGEIESKNADNALNDLCGFDFEYESNNDAWCENCNFNGQVKDFR